MNLPIAYELLDDLDERAGVKLNDSDLIGLPIRIVIGKDALDAAVEYVVRIANEKLLISIDEALMRVPTDYMFFLMEQQESQLKGIRKLWNRATRLWRKDD